MNRPTPMPEEPYFFACEIGAKTAQFRRLAEVGGTVARRPRTRQRATWSAIVGNGEWGTGNRNGKAGGGTPRPSAGKTKTIHAALPLFSHFMPTHLLFSTGLSAPKALGSPQYLAPVAQTMR